LVKTDPLLGTSKSLISMLWPEESAWEEILEQAMEVPTIQKAKLLKGLEKFPWIKVLLGSEQTLIGRG